MPRISPFIATRYNPTAVVDLSKVVAPPYDVIGPELQNALYDRSAHNVIRLILGKEHEEDDEYKNKYQRAATCLQDWKHNGTLIDDPNKCYYIYQQEYTTPDKTRYVRTGFFAAVRLSRQDKSAIHGHEHTFAGPKADRLKLLRATKCNLSPIFCLYSDPEKETDRLLEQTTTTQAPRIELTDDDGVIHRLWLISDVAQIKKLSALLEDKALFIADGHHRYETAVNYYRECQPAKASSEKKLHPSAYVLSFLTNCDAEGLQILPTHRVLSSELGSDVDHEELLTDLAEYFDVKAVKVDLKKCAAEGRRLESKLRELGRDATAFVLVLPGGKGYFLTLRASDDLIQEMSDGIHPDVARLDVSVLHEYLIPKVWVGNPEMELDDQDIYYVKDAGAALEMLGSPKHASGVFLMNPPTMDQVRSIASQGLRMPHKSTYFYPKLLSGIVLRDHSVA